MMRGLERTTLRTLSEVAPPGFKGTVRAMKTHGHTGSGKGKIDNPYALAWYMKKKGDKPHYKDQESSKKGSPVKFKKYQDEKDEAMSMFDSLITERELTTRGRKQINKGNFAIPEKAPGSGSYPIHDIAHARNALARVAQHGSPAEQSRVKKAVYSRYPSLKDSKEETVSSIFDDIIQEGSLPPALERFKLGKKGKSDDADDKPSFFKKDDDDADDKPDFLKKGDDDDADCSEQSMFDALVQESAGSIFDTLVESSGANTAAVNWEDRMARTLTLADELVSLRSSYKK